jgi:hypothetical protein
MGSAFTQTLANIYMLEWEQDLVKHQQLNSEIYGRSVEASKIIFLLSLYSDISMTYL